jgi:predicted DNA-binding protein with PD1-like motif
MLKSSFPTIVVAFLALLAPAMAADDAPNYIKTPTGYLMVLHPGDDVLANIAKLGKQEKIPSASITAIGFLGEVTFGFYDFSTKTFQPKTVVDVEMTNLTGSIAWKEGQVSIHAHATVAGGDFNAVGGHVMAARVGVGSVEVTVIAHDKRLERKIDPTTDANVLGLY